MTVSKVEVFEVRCDDCGDELSPLFAQWWFQSTEDIEDRIEGSSWLVDGERHLCRQCACLSRGHERSGRWCSRCSMELGEPKQ